MKINGKLKFLYAKWILGECRHLCSQCIFKPRHCEDDYVFETWKQILSRKKESK